MRENDLARFTEKSDVGTVVGKHAHVPIRVQQYQLPYSVCCVSCVYVCVVRVLDELSRVAPRPVEEKV